MSAIVVKFDEVRKYWTVNFCHAGKVETLMIGFDKKVEAVAYADHVKLSAKKVIVSPTTAELEAEVKRIEATLLKLNETSI